MKIGIITDTHVCGAGWEAAYHNPYRLPEAPARIRAAVEICRSQGVDHVLFLGDLTHVGDPESLELALDAAYAGDIPVWVVEGNHEHLGPPTAFAEACARERAYAPRLPSLEGELVDGIRFAGMANLARAGPVAGRFAAPGLAEPGPLPLDAWGDDPVLYLAHFPLLSRQDDVLAAGLLYIGGFTGEAEFAAPALRRVAPIVAVHGHLHVRDEHVSGPVLQVSCAALVEPPGEVTIIDISSRSGRLVVEIERLLVERVAGLRLPFMVPDRGRWTWDGRRWIDGLPERQVMTPPPPRVDLLACDWNGTLVNDFTRAWECAREVVLKYGGPDVDAPAFGKAFRLPLATLMVDLGVPSDAGDDAVSEWNALVAMRPAPLMPGLLAMLDGMSAAGIGVAVVSAADEAVIRADLARAGIDPARFTVIRGSAASKSQVLKELGAQHGRIAYIGDTEYDVTEAAAAGAVPLGFVRGYRSDVVLRDAGARALVASLEYLPALLGG